MGVSDFQFDTNGPVVDLSARGMRKLDPSFICSEETHTLILDQNEIMKLDHLERNLGLQQLSVASNRLVRMMGVSQLKELQVLNLPNNSIGYIEGLRDMPNLKWLNLSGNAIKVIEQLNNCVSLQHLDLSDNSITNIGDLSKLMALKTLLLHGNSITTLRTVPATLPAHVSILSLASNEIMDLTEVAHLALLHELEQLSIMNNPCVMPTPSLPHFDYRPYVMNWCLSLKVLDGFVVSQKEGLKAEWLYSQGKGRSFRPGQHIELIQYLSTVCLRTASSPLVTAEDAKLEKILNKQRFHQRQLLEETRAECPSLPRPTQLAVDILSQGDTLEAKNITPTPSAAAQSDLERGRGVQFNTWVSYDSSSISLPCISSPKHGEEKLLLEDVQTDEDKLNSSVLSSQSLTSSAPILEPQSFHSESEDETETFEADSLAPRRPTTTATAPPERPDQKEENGTLALELVNLARSLEEATRAAVKIQSWWRGRYTRCCHPKAREVRSEIRLRRMQDHIVSLTQKVERMQKQCEEERIQRMVQEEAVRFLWQQVQSMQQWQQSVQKKLAPTSAPSAAAACVAIDQPATDVSFPDSGFQTTTRTDEEQAAPEDSFLGGGTADSAVTVRERDTDSGDCSLLERYATSLQQREEEEAAESFTSQTQDDQTDVH